MRALLSVMLEKGFSGQVVLGGFGLHRTGGLFTLGLFRAFKVWGSFVSLQERNVAWSSWAHLTPEPPLHGNTFNQTHSGKPFWRCTIEFLMVHLSTGWVGASTVLGGGILSYGGTGVTIHLGASPALPGSWARHHFLFLWYFIHTQTQEKDGPYPPIIIGALKQDSQ